MCCFVTGSNACATFVVRGSREWSQVQTKAAINAMASTSMSSHEKAINADLLRRAAAPASH